MTKRKIFILISALLCSIFLLTACNNNKAGSVQNNPKSSAQNNSGQQSKNDPPTSEKAAPKTESKVVGVFSTRIIDYDENRIHNIRLAADKIKNCIIQPGEVFSFNDIVGKREYGKGYRKAAILVEGEQSEDVGGGICQLSTTIYNAALKSNMEIVERHAHSGEVKYVKKGRDAAVNYGDKDLKFKNTKSYPVKFNVSVGNGKVVVSIIKGV